MAKGIGASASASVLSMNIQGWFPLGLTGLILQSRGLSRVLSNTTVQKHQFFSIQSPLWSNSHIYTWPLEKLQFKTSQGSSSPELWGSMWVVQRVVSWAGLAWKFSLQSTCSGGKLSFPLVIEQTWLRQEVQGLLCQKPCLPSSDVGALSQQAATLCI